MPKPFERGVTYTLETRAGEAVAEVLIDEQTRSMIRWVGETEFVEDNDGLGMLLFPDEVGLRVRR